MTDCSLPPEWSPSGRLQLPDQMQFPEHADQSTWPAHMRDDAPTAICSSCGRRTVAQSEFGQRCAMPQPNGHRCEGIFSEPSKIRSLKAGLDHIARSHQQEPPVDSPAESPEFRRELARLLNSYSIDAYAEMPDHILADMLTELIPPLRQGRIATARWMDQPLLGEKLALRAERDGVQ